MIVSIFKNKTDGKYYRLESRNLVFKDTEMNDKGIKCDDAEDGWRRHIVLYTALFATPNKFRAMSRQEFDSSFDFVKLRRRTDKNEIININYDDSHYFIRYCDDEKDCVMEYNFDKVVEEF